MNESEVLLAGRYRHVRDLGRGAMGTVWLARDEDLARLVAIKRLLPEGDDEPGNVRRILREARTAAALQHPNSVVVLDRLLVGDMPYVVMEYVPGRTLAETIATEGPLSPERAAAVGAQLASVLAAAHRLGITHRDIKPANVLLQSDGTAKVADFGIARLAGDPALTATGQMIGTVAYMAPEVASDAADSPASDMWSLGATLFACVEGHPPYGGPGLNPSITAMLVRLVSQPVPEPRRAGPLRELIAALLDKDPDRRPSPSTARHSLAVVAGIHPLPARPVDDPWPRPSVDHDGDDVTRVRPQVAPLVTPQPAPTVPPVIDLEDPAVDLAPSLAVPTVRRPRQVSTEDPPPEQSLTGPSAARSTLPWGYPSVNTRRWAAIVLTALFIVGGTIYEIVTLI